MALFQKEGVGLCAREKYRRLSVHGVMVLPKSFCVLRPPAHSLWYNVLHPGHFRPYYLVMLIGSFILSHSVVAL